MKMKVKVKVKVILLLAALNFFVQPVLAQLPELQSAAAASGLSTTARFFAGASADDGTSYASSFAFDQPIDINVEIQVESIHVNTVGNLYVVINWDDILFMRAESGEYLEWDQNLATLQAAFPAKTLQPSEPISILNDVALGPLGVADTTIAIYLAYDSVATAGDLFYSEAPLMVTVQAQQSSSSSFSLYKQNISSQIIQSNCIICHVDGGAAGSSALQYVRSNTEGFQTTNYNILVNYINNVANGSSLLLSKPQGESHTGGVQLTAGSPNLINLEALIDAVLSEAE
jgi:hypothetical protein